MPPYQVIFYQNPVLVLIFFEVVEVAEVPEVEAEAKPETKKRVSRKKVELEPEVEAEAAEVETFTVEAPSSVMTSWNLSD